MHDYWQCASATLFYLLLSHVECCIVTGEVLLSDLYTCLVISALAPVLDNCGESVFKR